MSFPKPTLVPCPSLKKPPPGDPPLPSSWLLKGRKVPQPLPAPPVKLTRSLQGSRDRQRRRKNKAPLSSLGWHPLTPAAGGRGPPVIPARERSPSVRARSPAALHSHLGYPQLLQRSTRDGVSRLQRRAFTCIAPHGGGGGGG